MFFCLLVPATLTTTDENKLQLSLFVSFLCTSCNWPSMFRAALVAPYQRLSVFCLYSYIFNMLVQSLLEIV